MCDLEVPCSIIKGKVNFWIILKVTDTSFVCKNFFAQREAMEIYGKPAELFSF